MPALKKRPLAWGGYSWKIQVEVCDMLLETVSLFQTKISDFPHSISDLNNIKKVASVNKRTHFKTLRLTVSSLSFSYCPTSLLSQEKRTYN